MLTVGSLFTGVGMFDLGFRAAGFQIKYQVEYDEFCQKVLHARGNVFDYPDVYGDIRDCGVGRKHELPYTAVLIGGFPCQPFSIAGNRQGADDSRNMWGEYARLISELRPRAVCMENVPAICNPHVSPDGRIEPAYALTVIADLAQMGYDCRWGIISAADAGFPHQRNRWWVVGYANSLRPHESRSIENSGQDSERDVSSRQRTGQAVIHEAVADGQDVVNTPTEGLSRSEKHKGDSGDIRLPTTRSGRNRHQQRIPQPGLGRDAHGSTYRVDEPRHVARPGESQFAYESPRTLPKTAYGTPRLKATGNGLLPQIAYFLACGIKEVLINGGIDEN